MDLIFNPFKKIDGIFALLIGIIILIITSFIAGNIGIQFNNLITVQLSNLDGVLLPLMQNLTICLLLIVMAWALIKLFYKSEVNLLNLSGVIVFSRVPILFATLLGLFPSINRDDPYEMSNYFIGFGILFCVVWSLILLFKALLFHVNPENDKKWLVYIILVVSVGYLSGVLNGKLTSLIG